MKKSCVILNYNDASGTIEALARIRNYRCFDSIVIVDNGSDDGSLQKLKEEVAGNIFLVESNYNGGYGFGNNLGIRYAAEILQATHVVIANPDAVFSEECIEGLSELMEQHPEVAVAAPIMQQKDKTAASAWPLRSWSHELCETGPICRRVFKNLLNYPEGYLEAGGSRRAVYVGAVAGSLLMLDVKKMQESGGYDEAVFLYGEENMLGFNLRALGYKTALLLTENYMHINSASISKTIPDLLARQKLRNQSTMHYFKYYLGISVWQEIITWLFFQTVLAEIVLCRLTGKQGGRAWSLRKAAKR